MQTAIGESKRATAFLGQTLRLLESLRDLRANLRRRRKFKKLLELDDKMLNDIGLTRTEIIRGCGYPLDVNASILVHRDARLRRQAERAQLLKRRSQVPNN